MFDFILHSLWGWIGLGGLVVILCLVVAWFVPGFRLVALEVLGGVLAATAIYTKGAKDAEALEAKKKEAAVKKAQDDYAKIDARPDTSADVDKRLRDGSF